MFCPGSLAQVSKRLTILAFIPYLGLELWLSKVTQSEIFFLHWFSDLFIAGLVFLLGRNTSNVFKYTGQLDCGPRNNSRLSKDVTGSNIAINPEMELFLPFQDGKNPVFPDRVQSTRDQVLSIGDVLCTVSSRFDAPEGILSTILTRCCPCMREPHRTSSCDFDTSGHLANKESQSIKKWFGVSAFKSVGSLELGVRGRVFNSCSVRQGIVARSSSVSRCRFRTWWMACLQVFTNRSQDSPKCGAAAGLNFQTIFFWLFLTSFVTSLSH